MTNYLVIDVETSIKNRGEGAIGKMQGSPHCQANDMVIGGAYNGETYYTFGAGAIVLPEITVLVGHNIKFDMLYLLREGAVRQWMWDKNHLLWDTQQVEYLITGQQSKMSSLNKLSEKYGGTQKDDRVKEFWDNGVDTEDIPISILGEYLEYDVKNTHKVFLRQVEQVAELGMESLVRSQMRALAATIEMERNGMCFDKPKASKLAHTARKNLDKLEELLVNRFQLHHPNMLSKDISAGSNDCLSRVLFGGTYTYKKETPMFDDAGELIKYKSGAKKGQVKFKRVDTEEWVEGMFTPKEEWMTKKAGFYQVNDEVLKALNTGLANTEFLNIVIQWRALKKDCTTYLEGYSNLAWPTDHRHFIHGNLNHNSTDTGRLSSSSPNLQNLSGKERD